MILIYNGAVHRPLRRMSLPASLAARLPQATGVSPMTQAYADGKCLPGRTFRSIFPKIRLAGGSFASEAHGGPIFGGRAMSVACRRVPKLVRTTSRVGFLPLPSEPFAAKAPCSSRAHSAIFGLHPSRSGDLRQPGAAREPRR